MTQMMSKLDNVAHPSRFKMKWYWWVAGAGGGYLVFRGYENNKASQAAADAAATDTTGDGYTDPNYDAGTYGTDGFAPVHGSHPGSDNPPLPPPITTNAQWLDAAISYDTRHGFAVGTATVGLTKYLENRATALPEAQFNAVEAAIVYLGEPPIKVHPPTEKPPTHPKPPPKHRPPHRDVTYTTRKGDTLRIVSQRFYGNVLHIGELKKANRTVLAKHVGPMTRLQAGILLEIPNATRGFKK